MSPTSRDGPSDLTIYALRRAALHQQKEQEADALGYARTTCDKYFGLVPIAKHKFANLFQKPDSYPALRC